jgi:hypothetical protein
MLPTGRCSSRSPRRSGRNIYTPWGSELLVLLTISTGFAAEREVVRQLGAHGDTCRFWYVAQQ